MVKAIVIKFRRPLIVGFHIVLIVLANYLAFWIRFDGVVSDEYLALMMKMIPWLILIRGLTFVPFRLYQGLWRYTGIWDLRNVISGVIGEHGHILCSGSLDLRPADSIRSRFLSSTLCSWFSLWGEVDWLAAFILR